MNHPYGVCTDKYGRLLVADSWNHRVTLLEDDGRFIRHLVTQVRTTWVVGARGGRKVQLPGPRKYSADKSTETIQTLFVRCGKKEL